MGTPEQIASSLNFKTDIEPGRILIGSTYSGKFKYSFTHFLENLSDDEMEYALAKQCGCEFYIPLRGEVLSNEFINTCDKLFNDELEKFVMIEGVNTLKLTKSIIPYGPNNNILKEEYKELCLQV